MRCPGCPDPLECVQQFTCVRMTAPWSDPTHDVVHDIRHALDPLDADDLTPRPAGPLLPDLLRALADRIESQTCTGVAARWCPVHGTCTCVRGERADLDSPTCPLHAPTSSHAEAELSRMSL